MNASMNRLIHVEPVETIPVTCPNCAAALGTIDVHSLEQRMLWERESEPLSIAQPKDAAVAAEAGMIHGACLACSAELTAFWIAFERDRGVNAAAVAPRLSAALHAGSFTAWTVIEHRKFCGDVVEHHFGPVTAADADEAFARIREILADLSRPPLEAA
ncbi:hypothetical protein [Metallibacterium scheffleri]